MVHSLIFLWALMPLEMKPYFDQFRDDYAVRLPERTQITRVLIYFETKMPENIIGQCVMGFNIIRIDKGYWDRVGDYDRSDLLYHELGHCLFSMDHVDDPSDIMYKYSTVTKYPWYPRINRFFKRLENE